MKFAYAKLLILVTLLFLSGCSGEDPGYYQSKNVVRKRVNKPPEEIKKREVSVEETAGIVSKDAEQEIFQETVKAPAVLTEHETNIYVTKEGDTLSGISAKTHVYDNPMKWPLLYRDNPEALSSIKDKEYLYDIVLPAGMRLKITSPEEKKKTLEKTQAKNFTVNVISTPYIEELAPHVTKLIDEGYFIYISSTMVDNRKYYRLRIGFYTTRAEANSEGDKIKKLLNITDTWTAKISDEEFLDFGGY